MKRLFVANLSFEDELAAPGRNLPARLRRFEAEQATLWFPLAETGDLIACPEIVDADSWRRLAELTGRDVISLPYGAVQDLQDVSEPAQLVPWGWTPSIVALHDRRHAPGIDGATTPPELRSVLLVNSRRFAHELEHSLRQAPRGSCWIQSFDELEAAWAREPVLRAGWVIKSNFGQAGRGQLRGATTELPDSAAPWLTRQFASGGVVIEPYLTVVKELGLQWEISTAGLIQFMGVVEGIVDRRGQHLGSRVGADVSAAAEIAEIREIQQSAVEAMALAGYRGPVGVDAMVYRASDGALRVRALQDINARWTMGRIALHWAKTLDPTHEGGVWMFGRLPPSPTAEATSPERVGGQEVACRSWWIPHSGALGR